MFPTMHAPRRTTTHPFDPHQAHVRASRDDLVLDRTDGSACLQERAPSDVPDDRASLGFGYGAGIDARDGRASRKEVTVRTATLDARAAAYLPALPPSARRSSRAPQAVGTPAEELRAQIPLPPRNHPMSPNTTQYVISDPINITIKLKRRL